MNCLKLSEKDLQLMLAAGVHLGSENCNFQMDEYVHKRSPKGFHVFNLEKTWRKLLLAARAIVAIPHAEDIAVVAMNIISQRAVLKFSRYTGSFPFAGRFTPGTFTNQIQRAFREPRLLICHDPKTDHQAIMEASYVNIAVVAFCNTDSPLRYVDVAIPCNNTNPKSVGLMWWLLCREVLVMKGILNPDRRWEVMVDLFFYRAPEDIEKEENQEALAAQPAGINMLNPPSLRPAPGAFEAEDWGAVGWETDPTAVPHSAEVGAPAPQAQTFGAVGEPNVAAASFGAVTAEKVPDWGADGNDNWGAGDEWD